MKLPWKKNKLSVPPSPPFVKSADRTPTVMLDVIIALVPTAVWVCIMNGSASLVLLLIAVASSVVFEAAACLAFGHVRDAADLSAVVTGIIIWLCMTGSGRLLPGWAAAAAAFVGIAVVKQLFGGIGENLLNPALAGVLAVTLLFPDNVQAVGKFTTLEKILGKCPGDAGAISPLLVLLGGLYLLSRRVITWHIPAAYIVSVAGMAAVFNKNGADMIPSAILGALLESGVLLGVFFLADDYATSPCTAWGKIIYGAGCGVLSAAAVRYGLEGLSVPAAILVMNLAARPLDMLFTPGFRGVKKTEETKE